MRSANLVNDRPNSWKNSDCNLGYVLAEAQTAVAALDEICAAGIAPAAIQVPEAYLPQIATAYERLDELTRYLPKVECWCVVKYYHHPNWSPAVWVGCTTEAQARALAPALKQFYTRPGCVDPEEFRAERAPCPVNQIVRPEVTVEEYLSHIIR